MNNQQTKSETKNYLNFIIKIFIT